ncbi:MAG: hypothetical protein KTR17_10330 [Cellvibrionaceae bacterium]|nr:hypothetical protein [Cellvibrionaceae bacterium]
MASVDDSDKYKRKWWANPIDPEHIVELSDDDRRNGKHFNHWFLLWGLTFFGAVLGLEPLPGGIENTPWWRLLFALLPIVTGVFLVRAFIYLFSGIKDELIKKIYYEALAGGFLLAFFLGMGFCLSATIVGKSAIAGPFMFSGLIVGYFIFFVLACRKYNV